MKHDDLMEIYNSEIDFMEQKFGLRFLIVSVFIYVTVVSLILQDKMFIMFITCFLLRSLKNPLYVYSF